MCLYVKMTAMCEDVLFIESVTVNSLQSRTVSHCFGDADGGSSIHMIYSKMIRIVRTLLSIGINLSLN